MRKPSCSAKSGSCSVAKTCSADIVPRFGEADGILRSADLNPNTNGLELFGISSQGQNLAHIRHGIETGRIKALFVLHENLLGDAGWPLATVQKRAAARRAIDPRNAPRPNLPTSFCPAPASPKSAAP